MKIIRKNADGVTIKLTSEELEIIRNSLFPSYCYHKDRAQEKEKEGDTRMSLFYQDTAIKALELDNTLYDALNAKK